MKHSNPVAHSEGDTAVTALGYSILALFASTSTSIIFYHFQHAQDILDGFYNQSKKFGDTFRSWRETWRNAKVGSWKPRAKQLQISLGLKTRHPTCSYMFCIKLAMIARVVSQFLIKYDRNICRSHLGLDDHCMIAELLEESSTGTLQMSLGIDLPISGEKCQVKMLDSIATGNYSHSEHFGIFMHIFGIVWYILPFGAVPFQIST